MEEQAIVLRDESVRLGSLQLSNPEDVTRRASLIATELAKIIKERKLYRDISGRRYTFVEGWTTMGGMLGVIAREAHEPKFTAYENGLEEYESSVELVRMSDGMVMVAPPQSAAQTSRHGRAARVMPADQWQQLAPQVRHSACASPGSWSWLDMRRHQPKRWTALWLMLSMSKSQHSQP